MAPYGLSQSLAPLPPVFCIGTQKECLPRNRIIVLATVTVSIVCILPKIPPIVESDITDVAKDAGPIRCFYLYIQVHLEVRQCLEFVSWPRQNSKPTYEVSFCHVYILPET